jgi:hypothetical protein
MTKQKGTNYSGLLIWAAALVSIVRYSASFIASDVGKLTGTLSEIITIFMGVSGLGMGILDTIGTAYLFDGWRHAMPGNGKPWPFRFKVLTVFVAALFVTGLGILIPFTVSRVMQSSMFETLGITGTWLWGIVVNLAPILLIGGVAVGNQVVSVSQTETTGKNTGNNSENSGNFPVAKARWNKVDLHDYAWIAQAKTGEIQTRYGLDERTARNWRANAGKAVTK